MTVSRQDALAATGGGPTTGPPPVRHRWPIRATPAALAATRDPGLFLATPNGTQGAVNGLVAIWQLLRKNTHRKLSYMETHPDTYMATPND